MSIPPDTRLILAIESSCDDTAAAVVGDGRVLSNVISSQLAHQSLGGVVPELASRLHQSSIVSVVQQALTEANISLDALTALAVTQGPGLLGALHVGWNFAKGLSLARQLPLIPVDHIEAHLYATFAQPLWLWNDPIAPLTRPVFPHLSCIVSGGHTLLVYVPTPFEHQILGRTLDDAAGEAFDKASRMLGLPYPGGPVIDRLARQGDPARFVFSRYKPQELNFSFSGLKTSLLYFLQRQVQENPSFIADNLNDICASFQERIVDELIAKMELAIQRHTVASFSFVGGVSANSRLRQAAGELGSRFRIPCSTTPVLLATDNAAMIGYTAWLRTEYGLVTSEPIDGLVPYTTSKLVVS
jgi:N6-L-threonylcarbamoyladenine synthase